MAGTCRRGRVGDGRERPLRVWKGGIPVLPTWQVVLEARCKPGTGSNDERGGGFRRDPP